MARIEVLWIWAIWRATDSAGCDRFEAGAKSGLVVVISG